jgi:hypothetical protein
VTGASGAEAPELSCAPAGCHPGFLLARNPSTTNPARRFQPAANSRPLPGHADGGARHTESLAELDTEDLPPGWAAFRLLQRREYI